MKRIALLTCGLLLLLANTAEANWWYTPANGYTQMNGYARTNGYAQGNGYTQGNGTYTQWVPATQAAYSARPVQQTYAFTAYGTQTAQGVANIMASYNRVGHWGGNTGYEGCGAGATPAAAYHNCCYANSGMATVDVGYAQSASGMWYCCRRYR